MLFDEANAGEDCAADWPRDRYKRLVSDLAQLRRCDLIDDFDHFVGIGTVIARGARGRGCGPERHCAVAVDPAGQITQSNRRYRRPWAIGTGHISVDAPNQSLLKN